MPTSTIGQPPSLATFLSTSLPNNSVDSSVELLIALLKRRQIRGSRPCAIATAELCVRVVEQAPVNDAASLIRHISQLGHRLTTAQPRELTVGNVVRRILSVVREVGEDEGKEDETDLASSQTWMTSRPRRNKLGTSSPTTSSLAALPSVTQTRPDPLADSFSSINTSHDRLPRPPALPSSISYSGQSPQTSSMLNLRDPSATRTPFSTTPSPNSTSQPTTPGPGPTDSKLDLKREVISGIHDLLEELTVASAQIAESALDHIHRHDTVLTHNLPPTTHRFLAAAARKRPFTLFIAESHPAPPLDPSPDRTKPLAALGVTVVLVPDTAVFALMPRVTTVLLAPHAVLATGALLVAAGARSVAAVARAHRVPVVALAAVYQLSPISPFDADACVEHGDPGRVVGVEEAEFRDRVAVVNPETEWVPAENVDLYVTNVGGCAPSYLHRVVADHYDVEDMELSGGGM